MKFDLDFQPASETPTQPASDLQECAADVSALFRTFDCAIWGIHRMDRMEFLDDQLFGMDDRLNPAFSMSLKARIDRDRYNFHGFIIRLQSPRRNE